MNETPPATVAPSAAPIDVQARRRRTGVYLFMATSVFWGANIPITSLLFDTFDPYFMSLLRIALSVVVLGALMVAIEGPGSLRIRVPVGRWLVMCFVMAAFYTTYNLSLAHTHPITASALLAGSPVYAAVLLWLLTRAPLVRGFAGAAVLTMLGGAVAVFGKAVTSGQTMELRGGEPLVIFSLCCWTLYSYLAQSWFASSVTQLQRTFLSMVGALFWLTVSWGVMRAFDLVGPANLAPDATAIGYLLFTAVFATALGSIAWNMGVNRAGLDVGSLWQNTVPVFSVLTAMLFGLNPTGYQLVGGALVMAGVGYLQWRQRSAYRG